MPTRKKAKSVQVKRPALKNQKKKINGLKRHGIDKTVKLVAGAIASEGFDLVYHALEVAVEIDEDEVDETDEVEINTALPSELLIADEVKPVRRDCKTVFDMDDVEDPLIGTPMEVRKELDALAMRLQRKPKDQAAFLKIVCYMHKYILGLVFRKYNYVRGHDDKDIYQEALIALFKKAVPSFRKGKGMSFLNFAKMCINRHLITILNSSRNRRKDIPLNTSISLDHAPPGREDDDDSCLLSNIIPDTVHGKPPFTEITKSESFNRTLGTLSSLLSPFEQTVLSEYLKDKSYREASKSVSKICGKRCNERSIDNALLRIRKKAMTLKHGLGEEELPLVFGNVET